MRDMTQFDLSHILLLAVVVVVVVCSMVYSTLKDFNLGETLEISFFWKGYKNVQRYRY